MWDRGRHGPDPKADRGRSPPAARADDQVTTLDLAGKLTAAADALGAVEIALTAAECQPHAAVVIGFERARFALTTSSAGIVVNPPKIRGEPDVRVAHHESLSKERKSVHPLMQATATSATIESGRR